MTAQVTLSADKRKGGAMKTYGIKSLYADMTARNGFKYPTRGRVEAPDWDPSPKCGGGIHFLASGQNDPGIWPGEKFVCLKISGDAVDLGGKSKCRRAYVMKACDSMADLCAWMTANGIAGSWYKGTSTSGYKGTSTSGYGGTSTSGDWGTSTSGYKGTIMIWRPDYTRRRLVVGYIGEGGLQPNVAYKLDKDGNFVEAGRNAQ
jgi:hypothetical protein